MPSFIAFPVAMASENPKQKPHLYPEVEQLNPNAPYPPSSSSNLYPIIDMSDIGNLIPQVHASSGGHQYNYPGSYAPSAPPMGAEEVSTKMPYSEPPPCSGGYHETYYDAHAPSAPQMATEEVLIKVPGAILHLIDKSYSVELACGDFTVLRICQGENLVAVLARVGDEIQWPLTKSGTAVKLDDSSHYFFSLSFPEESDSNSDEEEAKSGKKGSSRPGDDENMLNYGLTILSKGQEELLRELDGILQNYCCFSEQKVTQKGGDVLDGAVAAARDLSPADLKSGKTKEAVEEKSAAYWTTLAPNVEDYSGTAAKMIAAGSGQLIRGILWCGDVTGERLKWGNEVLKKRMTPGADAEISPETLKRIKRVRRVTKTTEKVAKGVLTGVLKVSSIFSSKLANSKMGKKLFGLLPGEMVLATLDGFCKVCDAAEEAGKNVMATSSTVTTDFVNHRYGEKAAEATHEGLGAAGHAIGTAWISFKLRKALNPKSAFSPSSLSKDAVKAAAADYKAKKSKK